MPIMIVKELMKSKNLPQRKYTILSAYLISERLSPYFSAFYIRRKTTPNQITIHMILSGIIGAVFFSLPWIHFKIVGALLIHLWFILDFSDGEVARYTKTFSRYGKELDFMAHLINHPLFGISLFFSLAQLGKVDASYLAILLLTSNLLDYLYRNFVSLDVLVKTEGNNSDMAKKEISEFSGVKKYIFMVLNLFIVYPNIILFSVLLYFVDVFFNTDIVIGYVILNILFSLVFAIRRLVQLTLFFYK
jgi:phosphatidylglycerophosphate synthase